MTVKVALVISDKNYRASPSGKGSIRKVQTEIYIIIPLTFPILQAFPPVH